MVIKKVALLVTVRGEERKNSLMRLLQFEQMGMVKNHFEIHKIIVEQDVAPHFKSTANMYGCQYVLAHRPKGFNRSWGFNVGVKECSVPADLFICCDVDVLFPSFWIPEIVHKFSMENHEILLPFRNIFKIEHHQVTSMCQAHNGLTGGPGNPIDQLDTLCRIPVPAMQLFTHDGSIGTVCAVRRDYYERAQGHNEMYETWGCEDVDWANKCEVLTGTHLVHRRTEHNLFHIMHPMFKPDFQSTEFHRQNLELTDKIWSIEREKTVQALKNGTLQPNWGDIRKYA